MANPWFRMYNEILEDPKVQKLPPDLFKAWVNILALASRHGGKLPDLTDCAFAFRLDEIAMQSVIDRLVSAILIDKRNGGPNGWHYAPHEWAKRQYKSDTSTERVKRFREKNQPLPETPPETDSDTDTEQSREGVGDDALTRSPSLAPIHDAFALWNRMAASCKPPLPEAKVLTDPRRRALARRLAEAGGLDGWHDALRKVKASKFLRGANDRGWIADLDFVLQKKSFTKLMEGSYVNRESTDNGSGESAAEIAYKAVIGSGSRRKENSRPFGEG